MLARNELIQEVKELATYLPDTGFKEGFIEKFWDVYKHEFRNRRLIDIGAGEKLDFLPHALFAGVWSYVAVEPCEKYFDHATTVLYAWLKTEQMEEHWAHLKQADALEYLIKQSSDHYTVVSFGVFDEFQANVDEAVEYQYMQEYAKEVYRVTVPGALTVQWPLKIGYGRYFEEAGFEKLAIEYDSTLADPPIWRKRRITETIVPSNEDQTGEEQLKTDDTPLSYNANIVLEQIVTDPLIGIRERIQKTEITQYNFQKGRKELVNRGLIKNVPVRTTAGGRSKTFLEVTSEGHNHVNIQSEADVYGAGGVRHKYYCKRITEWIEDNHPNPEITIDEKLTNNKDRVDILFNAGDIRTALEVVVTSIPKKDKVKKILDEYDTLLIVGENKVVQRCQIRINNFLRGETLEPEKEIIFRSIDNYLN